MIRKTVHYSGRVQGVGFRYTICQIAAGFAVAGYVKNLRDGRVEVVVEAAPEEVERFLAALDREMASQISTKSVAESPGVGGFRGFDVHF